MALLFSSYYRLTKHLPQEIIVRFFLELECLDVLEVAVESESIIPVRLEEVVDLRHLLESSYFLVLFSFVVDLNSLPGQLSDQEVEQKIS